MVWGGGRCKDDSWGTEKKKREIAGYGGLGGSPEMAGLPLQGPARGGTVKPVTMGCASAVRWAPGRGINLCWGASGSVLDGVPPISVTFATTAELSLSRFAPPPFPRKASRDSERERVCVCLGARSPPGRIHTWPDAQAEGGATLDSPPPPCPNDVLLINYY